MSDTYGGKLRTFGHKKAGTSNFSNPSLVSPTTPTLANPTRGFGLPTNNIIQTATKESTDQQEAQSADEQSLLSETIQQRSFGHDLSRIALRRPQAELTMAEPGDKYEMETSESNDQQGAQPAGEKSLLSQAIEQQSFGHHISRYALRRPQAKLTLGEPGDKYEQEADWMANQVMRMVVPDKPNADSVQPVEDTLQHKCTACEEEEEVQRSSDSVVSTPIALEPQPTPEIQGEPNGMPPTKGTTQITKNNANITGSGKNITEAITNLTSLSISNLQRQADGVPQVQPDLESRLNSSQGGGSPLPDEVRSFMEPRFGADFSQVRVHTGSEAVQMNQDVNAQAFTRGSDIYYGGGKSPGNNDLTAHELTHVVQQTGAVQQKPGGTQAEPVPKSTEIDSQTANLENSQNVERIVNQIVNALQADPGDQSGRIKQLFARLNASTRQAVLTQLQARLTPEQQHSLQTILSKPSPTQTELPSEQMAPHEQSSLDDQHQRNVGSSQNTEQKPQNQVPTDSSQTPSASGQERKSGSKTSDTPESQQATSDQASSSSPSKNGASVATEQANSQQATISKSGSRQGSAQKDTSTSHQGEGQAATAKTGAASSKGNASLAQAGTQATSSEARSGSSSSVSQRSGQGVSRSSAVNQGRSPNQSATGAQPLQSPEVQVSSARSQNTQALLEQVATTANSARQRFTERITQGTEAIASSLQQQQTALMAAGEQQMGAIQALFADARAQVGEIISSSQGQLQTDAESHLATLAQGHTATLQQVGTAFSSGQEQVQNLGDTYAERSLKTADDSAQQVQTRIQGMAQEARNIGQEKAQVGGNTPEIAQAKATAANEIASDTASKITSGVSDAIRDLRATGPETARGFREQGQEAARQVGAGQTQIVDQLNTSNQQTVTGIQQAVTQGGEALGTLGTQLIEQLTSLEQTIQNQLQTEIAQKNQELGDVGQQAITTFQEQGQQAIASGDEHLAQFNQQVAEMDIDPELAAEVIGEIVGQVDGAYDNLIATTDGAFQQADSALTQAGTEVITAINGISTNAAGQIQTFLGQAQGQVTQQVGTISGQLGTTVSQANTASSGMVSQVTTSLTGQLGQIDTAFGQGLEKYQGGLDQQVKSAESQAGEPKQSLPGRIDQGQHKAEEKARHSLLDDPLGWVGDQLSDLWDMLSDPGFWAGLLVGLLIAGAVVLLVAAEIITGGTITILIAAVVAGVLAAGVGTLVSQVTKGSFSNLLSPDWSLVDWKKIGISMLVGGLFGAGLAVAEILGAGVIGLAITAGILTVITNVVTGQPWDKNLLANMLLVGVLSKLFRLARGKTPGTEPPGTEPPGTEPPGTEPPGTEPPGTEPPGTEPPGTEPPGTEPPGTEPPGTEPPGTEPPGTEPPGTEPPGTEPPGTEPPVPTGRGVPLNKVRYSQKTVKGTTSEGQTIDQVAANMRKNGWDYSKPQPDMIDWGDGEFQTLDHRRLVAANRAKLEEVGANIHPANEPIPSDQAGRFPLKRAFTDPETGTSYAKGQLPKTWGEAAMFRSANQGKNFPIRGSHDLPTVTGGSEE